MTEPCTRTCKQSATVILERNGKPYCRPHGLSLALRRPVCPIWPIDPDKEVYSGVPHAESPNTTVCRGMRVRGEWVNGCGSVIVWVVLPGTGNKMPIDTEAIPRPKRGLVAYNPDTGNGKVLTDDDVESGRAAEWAAKHRMTFHRTHFGEKRCPVVQARMRQPLPDESPKEKTT